MIRCACALVASLVICAAPAAAQIARPFPATALRGELIVTQAPEALLNGRNARLAPGARIRGENNLLLVSGALTDQRLVVNYTVDVVGLVFEVWILTPQERAMWPWPVSPQQAATWSFDAAAQTWSKP